MIAQIDKIYFKLGMGRVARRLAAYFLEGRPLMSKARWANHIVSPVLKMGACVFNGRSVSKPIFILGMGRSGTTFLGNVLSTHRKIAYLHEPKLMWHLCIANNDLNGDYTQEPARYRLTAADAQKNNGDKKIRATYAFWQRLSFAPRVADKYPELIFRMPMIQHIFPDAKCLAIIRHGAAVASSVRNLNNTKLGPAGHIDNENWWGKHDKKWKIICNELVPNHPELQKHAEALKLIEDDYNRTAVEWILTMEEILSVQKDFPGKLLAIKYEELIAKPDVIVPDMMRFCELDVDSDMLPFMKESSGSYKEKKYAEVKLVPFLQPIFNGMLTKLGY